MIKDINSKPHGIEIDLTGSEGNAFCLMGMAKRWYKQLAYTPEKIEARMADMMSSDYEHLLAIMEEDFGSIVTFYR